MRTKLAIVCLGLCAVLGAAYYLVSWRYATGPIDRKIVATIKEDCAHQRPCVFLLEEGIANPAWDTMYVFSDQANQREVESVLHAHLSNFREFSSTLAFMEEGRLVHWEQEHFEMERPTPESLNFEMPEGSDYRAYSPGTLFSISIEYTGARPYYFLHPWPCKPGSHDISGKACPLPQ